MASAWTARSPRCAAATVRWRGRASRRARSRPSAASAAAVVWHHSGDGATGYLIVAIFPPGGWDDERDDFERIVRSFRTDVPPGLETFPVDGQAS